MDSSDRGRIRLLQRGLVQKGCARLGVAPFGLEGHPIGGRIIPPGLTVRKVEIQDGALEVEVIYPDGPWRDTVGAVSKD